MKILYDPILKQPACPILQAARGCSTDISYCFDTKDWLLAPTPDMDVFEVTPEQMLRLIEITERRK